MKGERDPTLNLPTTDFPMQGNLARREPAALARWESERVYEQVRTAHAGAPPFLIVDGPPYANGDIHIGHSVNKVLKDIVLKAARLDGLDARLVVGWDCHGLPIELQVEKTFGRVGDGLDAATFRQKCREYAAHQVARQREAFKRLGILADWGQPYLTMDREFEAEQLRLLAQIVKRGHLVRGCKPVNWCLDCMSSLAEAEVEHRDRESAAIDVSFRATEPEDIAKRCTELAEGESREMPIEFVIWTTTPWTLPANQAICVNPSATYVLLLHDGRRLVVAESLAADVCARLAIGPAVVGKALGSDLVGATAAHPFCDRVVPIVFGEHVTLDAGTGLVHTAPAHGPDDYAVSLQFGLPIENPVGADGTYAAGTEHVAGLHVRKAEETILRLLRERGALLSRRTITHSYPHCWRHKTPVIFRATPQWFLSMEEKQLRHTADLCIEQTRWIPAWGRDRIRDMVTGRPDWCISRQRYWGVPLAVFTSKADNSLHPDTAVLLARIADRVAAEGLEAWFGSDCSDWGVDSSYEKGTDVLDVWFDSGSAHQCAFKSTHGDLVVNGESPQADLYLEGSDQHRGWFQSSLLLSAATLDRPPFKAVLTHGFTVDEQGRKMSKSIGNVVSPQTVVDSIGADALRLWVSSVDYSRDIPVSQKLIAHAGDAYRRIRNTSRFLLGNLADFDPALDAVDTKAMLALDRWALATASAAQKEIREAYQRFEFHQVYQKILNYCVVELGGLYLDVLKDRLYTLPSKSRARRSAQTALFHIAEALVRWMTPILSFTADEVWRSMPGQRLESVFAQRWYEFPPVESGDVNWPLLLKTRQIAHKALEDLRATGAIGGSLDAEIVVGVRRDAEAADLRTVGEELKFWLVTSDASLVATDEEELQVVARKSDGIKCSRCWHHRSDVAERGQDPKLCLRCVTNTTGIGEQRTYF